MSKLAGVETSLCPTYQSRQHRGPGATRASSTSTICTATEELRVSDSGEPSERIVLFMFQRPELLVTRTYDDGKTMDHIRSHCSEEVPVNRQRTLSAHSGRALLDTVRQPSYYAHGALEET